MSWGKLVTPVEPLGFALTSDQLIWMSILSWDPCTAVFSLTVSEDRAQSWSLHTLLDCHYASFLPVSGISVHMSKLPWDILEQITAGGLSFPQWETFLSCLNIWGDYTNNNKSVINECLKDIKSFYQWLTKFATKLKDFVLLSRQDWLFIFVSVTFSGVTWKENSKSKWCWDNLLTTYTSGKGSTIYLNS